MLRTKVLIFIISVTFLFMTNTSANIKQCRLMSPHIHEISRLELRENWNQLAGYFCYIYNDKIRFNFTYKISQSSINGSTFYFSKAEDDTYFFYDYSNATSLKYIKPTFVDEIFFEKWKTCCKEAEECCDNTMTETNIHPSVEYPCPAMWDSWTCFNPAEANTVVQHVCPVATYSSQTRSCELLSQKECLPSGAWTNSTDYTVCSIAPVLRNRHNFHTTVLAISAALSFPAVLIFFSFRTLRQKIIFLLHRNLILVIVIRNILTIMTKEILILNSLNDNNGETILTENSAGCRVLAFFENLSKNGIFVCMLLDGFYLHKTIVRPFAQELKQIYLVLASFVMSVIPSLIWALLRSIHNGSNCWLIDDTQDQWISDGFRIAILTINTLLLLDIIRVMILKLKDLGVSQQTKTTLRATLFLIPLFGIHIFIISNRNLVPGKSCNSQDIYYYLSYSIEALQGLIVATLFCYINPEVHREFLNVIRRVLIYAENHLLDKSYKRRPTTGTLVESFSEQN